VPVHGIVRVLEQVGRFLAGEEVGVFGRGHDVERLTAKPPRAPRKSDRSPPWPAWARKLTAPR
jgi:hypothetical protein